MYVVRIAIMALAVNMKKKMTRMGGSMASGVATSETACWPDPCTTTRSTTSAEREVSGLHEKSSRVSFTGVAALRITT